VPERIALAVALGLALAAPAAADPEGSPDHPGGATPALAAELGARADVVARTIELLDAREREQAAQVTTRLRALYKLVRAGHDPLWFDRRARGELARRRAAARVVARDLRELDLIEGEGRAARRASAAIARARGHAVGEPPARGSLARPVDGAIVAGFGPYRERGVELVRRGIELATAPGAPIGAPSTGTVTWVGPLRGLGRAIVLEQGGAWIVIAGVGATTVAAGDPVARGTNLGVAAGDRVGVEVRLRGLDPAGTPIDPRPLLER
jgi:murein DD-endopeptidase MepM/ murein hydrolase activator NlpD